MNFMTEEICNNHVSKRVSDNPHGMEGTFFFWIGVPEYSKSIDGNNLFFLVIEISYNDITINILSDIPNALIQRLTLRVVLDFLEDGTVTAVSDHFGFSTFTKADQKITWGATGDTIWYPLPCGKDGHHSVVIRNLLQGFIVIVSEHSVPIVCAEVTSLIRNRQGMLEVTLEIKQLQQIARTTNPYFIAFNNSHVV